MLMIYIAFPRRIWQHEISRHIVTEQFQNVVIYVDNGNSKANRAKSKKKNISTKQYNNSRGTDIGEDRKRSSGSDEVNLRSSKQ